MENLYYEHQSHYLNVFASLLSFRELCADVAPDRPEERQEVDGGHGQEHIEQRQENLGKCQWIFAIIQTDTTAW